MKLHRYPQEKPKKRKSYLVHYCYGNGHWDVIQWSGKRFGWTYWSDYSDGFCSPNEEDIDYWAELPEIPNDK